MSYLQQKYIRTAIVELVRGSIGTTRVVPAGMFGEGVHAGQKPSAQQAKALNRNYTHRFDVAVRVAGVHEASAVSVKTSSRISRFAVEIMFTTKLKSVVQDEARDDVLARVAGDGDVVIQALNYPNNLLTTNDGEATGIVSGMLLGPDNTSTPRWELVEENWEQQLLRSRIVAEAIVIQVQAVA